MNPLQGTKDTGCRLDFLTYARLVELLGLRTVLVWPLEGAETAVVVDGSQEAIKQLLAEAQRLQEGKRK